MNSRISLNFPGVLRSVFRALAACASVFSTLAAQDLPALSSNDAIKKFRLEPGCRIELVAAEPLVASPCALAWDESGRLFVAENRGYPVGNPDGSPVGRVALLEDADGDGEIDKRTDFATSLAFPNGLLPWKGGLLVTDAPNLYWMTDTNHDGRADVREVWFSGFATNQSTQLRACYPTLGPDGWIYLSRGWSGGIITSPKWTNLPAVDLKDGDFRFRPDGSAAEAIGGNSQFGLVIDDVGRRFSVSNRNPLMHVVAPPRWWRRVPSLEFSAVVQDVSPTGYEARVHPLAPDLTSSGFYSEYMSAPHAGTYTSACGIHQFFGEGLDAEFQGNWFICEPAQNLIQRQIAERDGPSFRSHAVPFDRDFLASADPWFHPVSTWTGPDGALYVADMYRKFIDHPEYMPEEARAKIDFNAGNQMGRIWRIRKMGHPAKAAAPQFNLATASAKELIDALSAPNIWTRQTADRLLLGQNLTNVIALLTERLEASFGLPVEAGAGDDFGQLLNRWSKRRRDADPAAGPHLGESRMLQILFDRVSVLVGPKRRWPSFGGNFSKRVFAVWLAASMAESPSIREAAWRVMQPISDEHNPIPDVGADLLERWTLDPSAAVRFHLAYCLGQGNYGRMTDALVDIVRLNPDNRWTRAVVLSGLQNRQHQFVTEFLARKFKAFSGDPVPPIGFNNSPGLIAFAEELSRLCATGAGAEELWRHALDPAADGSIWQIALLRGLAEGSRHIPSTNSATDRLSPLNSFADRMLNSATSKTVKAPSRERFSEVIASVISAAQDAQTPLARRTNAIALLGELDFAQAGATLAALLTPSQPKDAQLAAARALGRFNTAEAGRELAARERWNGYTPAVREIALNALLSQPRQLPALLDALENGTIPLWAIPANRRRQIQNQSDPEIRARAGKLFGGAGDPSRRKVFEEYKPVLALKGAADRGHAVFTRICSICHQYGGEGARVGPDLTGVKNQPPEALLLHILVPDAEIYPGFLNYECETKDGRSLGGILVAESENSVTLRRALGEEETIPREQIKSLTAGRSSLMPAELEKSMTRQDLADLLAFLRGEP